MRTWQKAFVIGGPAFILGLQIVFMIILSTPSGIRIDHPGADRTVPLELPVTGNAWIRGGIERVEVVVEGAAGTATFPAERSAVTYGGEIAFFLAPWTAKVVFPSEGRFVLRARAVGRDGSTATTDPRWLTVAAGARLREFRPWTPIHFVPLALLAAAWIALPVVVRRADSQRLNARVALALSLVLWIDEIVYQFYWFGVGAWMPSTALMLHMCGISILVLPWMFSTSSERLRRWLFEIMFFWGLGGALQGLLAPDVGLHGFPEMKYIGYFVSHGTIIASVLFAAAAWRIELTGRSFLRNAVVTNIAVGVAYGINQLLRLIPPYEVGNYFVIGYPPPQGSVIDLFASIFGPAPRYLIGLELMGVVVFGIIYLPYPIRRLVRRARAASPGSSRSSRAAG